MKTGAGSFREEALADTNTAQKKSARGFVSTDDGSFRAADLPAKIKARHHFETAREPDSRSHGGG